MNNKTLIIGGVVVGVLGIIFLASKYKPSTKETEGTTSTSTGGLLSEIVDGVLTFFVPKVK